MRLALGRDGQEEEKTQLITRHTLSEAKACTIQRVLRVDDNP